MTVTLTTIQMNALQVKITNGDIAGFYDDLSGFGDSYGEMGAAITRNDNWRAEAINNFAASAADRVGLVLDYGSPQWQSLNADLAQAYLDEYLDNSGGQPTWQEIRDFHIDIYPVPGAWFPERMLERSSNPGDAWDDWLSNNGIGDLIEDALSDILNAMLPDSAYPMSEAAMDDFNRAADFFTNFVKGTGGMIDGFIDEMLEDIADNVVAANAISTIADMFGLGGGGGGGGSGGGFGDWWDNLFGPGGGDSGQGSPAMPPNGAGPANQGSPLVLDLDGDGIELSALGSQNTYFDLRGNGSAVLTGWVGPDDGLLTLDINENGFIDDASELFGNQTTDGFAVLAAYDLNNDRIIDATDSIFSDLLVWKDANSDGLSQEDELYTLSELNITSINLQADRVGSVELEGNHITHESTFEINGNTRSIVDAWFTYDVADTKNVAQYVFDIRTYFLPTLEGHGDLKNLHIAASIDNGPSSSTLIEKMMSFITDLDVVDAVVDWGATKGSVDEIMLRWAGVDAVNPTGRGSYVNGQHLAFYEAYTGQPFLQDGKSNPLFEAGSYVEAVYNHIKTVFTAQMLLQAGGDEFFVDAGYDVRTGQIKGDLDLLQTGIDAISDAAINAVDGIDVWVNFAVFLAYTKGLDNLTVGETAALDIAVADLSEPSLTDWQDVLNVMLATVGPVISESSDWGSFEIYYDNYTAGTSGADTITDDNAGGNHNNEFYGLDGNDTINALDGHDKLVGGAGNDTLNGGSGDDYLIGGIGDDIYQYESGSDTISEIDGGGYDEIRILSSTGLTTSNVVDLYRYNDELILSLSTGSYITIEGYSDPNARIEKIVFESNSSFIDLAALVEQKFYGTAGADHMTVSGTNVQTLVVYGYNSNDVLTVDGASAKFYGGNGYDTLIGDYLSDQLYGEDGDDYLFGADGNDILTGGNNNDTLVGGDDNDTLYGGSGDDVLKGEEGNDWLEGGSGNDTYIFAEGDGDDIIYNYSANATTNYDILIMKDIVSTDVTIARDDDDWIISLIGSSDSITLRDQNNITSSSVPYFELDEIIFSDSVSWTANSMREDYLANAGTSGGETIVGFFTDDIMDGKAGNDRLEGGNGGDTYIYGVGSGNDVIYDYPNYVTWALPDTIEFGAGITQGDLAFSYSGDNLIITITSTSETLTVEKQFYHWNFFQIENFVFSNNTSLTASDVYDLAIGGVDLVGTSGNDTLSGAGGRDRLEGMAGNDTLNGNAGNDILDGGDGNDLLKGGANDDIYIASNGLDTIEDASGTDTIVFGPGITAGDLQIRRVIGSYPHDHMTIEWGSGNKITITDQYTGADYKQIETIRFDDNSTLNLLTVTPITEGNASANTLNGEESSMYNRNDIIYGYGGNDTINGGVGDDIIWGGDGDDVITDTAGNNTIYGEGGNDDIEGSTDIDIIYGGDGNDDIDGDFGDDKIYGGDGNDILQGWYGNDLLDGGAGDDTITGGSGTDIVTYASASAAVTVNLATTTAQNTVGAGTDTITTVENVIGSAYNDTITGNSSANLIQGGAGDDALNGAGGTDTLSYSEATSGITVSLAVGTAQNTGGAGTDTISNFENLTGSEFNDTLTGSSIANTINGLGGNDVIEGGAGNDILDGGGGTDTLTYVNAASAVTVNLSTASSQNTGGAGSDTISNFENLTGSAYNDTLTGNSSGNVLYGGAGTDTISGGDGNDFLYGGAGVDTLAGGNDADTFILKAVDAFASVDTISDFNTGQGDKIDIIDLLVGYDPLQSAIDDFVTFTTSGGNSIMSVDRDGTASTYTSAQVATISGVTGLDPDTLLANGNLIAS